MDRGGELSAPRRSAVNAETSRAGGLAPPRNPLGLGSRRPTVKPLDPSTARKTIAGLSIFVVAAVGVVLYVLPHRYATTAVVTAGAGLRLRPDALATTNAVLNAGSAVGLVLGFLAIKKKRVALHRACMSTSFVLSSMFLVTYLVHHARVGSVRFEGPGLLRTVYFAVLLPHVLLAILIVPLALTTLYRGLIRDVPRHRAIARWTLPLWLYVSVSGVLLYFMLYHLR
jgi:putative membrane protein